MAALSIWHEEADATVAIGNADALARQWTALHGLSETPGEVRSRRGWRQALWRAVDGRILVEDNRLRGLGHGTPLSAAGEDALGEVGPFMLEAGVSAALAARFWGLAKPSNIPWDDAPERERAPSARRSLGDQVLASISPHVSADVEKVITQALRSAGLLVR